MKLAMPAVATESVAGETFTITGTSVMVALLDFVWSITEVAVTVTVPPGGIVAGAV
jgi:hypothetical protein